VAHILRRCSCYSPGSELGDPPGFTKRQAAKAALDLFTMIETWYKGGTPYIEFPIDRCN
jgi:hypothetical protein